MPILSIQSHVAYGHVGNSATVFPLQRMGWEVWAVHTVMFAAHAGYGPPRGPVFSPDTVRDVLTGIAERGVLPQCQAVLSGYLGDAALGEAVLEAVAQVKQANPAALYCCDPVMGDHAPGIYVRDGIPDFMRDKAIPAADIITPNVFELELLTGIGIADLTAAIAASRQLIRRGPRLVLVTSLQRDDRPADQIEMLAVTEQNSWIVSTPKFDLSPAPNGAGDLTAALFLATYLDTRQPAAALGQTAAAVHGVFATTSAASTRELALIAAQDSFVSPGTLFKVIHIDD